jgi:hypothetical protein
LPGLAAPFAAFVAITQTAGGAGQNPKGRSGSGGWRRPAILLRAAKRAGQTYDVCFNCRRAAENSRTQPLPARAACRPIALQKAEVAPSSGIGLAHDRPVTVDRTVVIYSAGTVDECKKLTTSSGTS